mgnify:CR=1 FL=1
MTDYVNNVRYRPSTDDVDQIQMHILFISVLSLWSNLLLPS